MPMELQSAHQGLAFTNNPLQPFTKIRGCLTTATIRNVTKFSPQNCTHMPNHAMNLNHKPRACVTTHQQMDAICGVYRNSIPQVEDGTEHAHYRSKQQLLYWSHPAPESLLKTCRALLSPCTRLTCGGHSPWAGSC